MAYRWLVQEGDSAGKKLSGSVINALIFVGIMTITTFIMVLLFKYGVGRSFEILESMSLLLQEDKYFINFLADIIPALLFLQYTKIIYGYLGFSGFSIFFLITGIIIIELIQKAGGHMDWFSFSYILFNFAVSTLDAFSV